MPEIETDPPTTEAEPAIFNPMTLVDGNVTLSWTGDGTLEEAASPGGPWKASTDQANSQSFPVVGTKFYRLQQGHSNSFLSKSAPSPDCLGARTAATQSGPIVVE